MKRRKKTDFDDSFGGYDGEKIPFGREGSEERFDFRSPHRKWKLQTQMN